MKKTTLPLILVICGAVVFMLSACRKDSTYVALQQRTINLATGLPDGSYTGFPLFNLQYGTQVSNVYNSSDKWDFGLRGSTFVFNSGVWGIGNAGVIVVDKDFNDVLEAPETGYAYDTTLTQLAIHDYTVWADYDADAHLFTPKSGKTFIIRTGDGLYGKMEVLSVNIDPITGPFLAEVIYKIRYSIQRNGTRKFTIGT